MGETGNSDRFYFLRLQNHCGQYCSHEIKRCLFPGGQGEAMINLNRGLKSRDITLPTKVCTVKTMVFPVVMYRCESWTIKKAERQELMFLNCGAGENNWESKGNQLWVFTGRTCAKAEALIIWPPGVKSRLTGKDPDAGKIEGRRLRQQERMRWLDSITDSMDMNLSKFRDTVNNR